LTPAALDLETILMKFVRKPVAKRRLHGAFLALGALGCASAPEDDSSLQRDAFQSVSAPAATPSKNATVLVTGSSTASAAAAGGAVLTAPQVVRQATGAVATSKQSMPTAAAQDELVVKLTPGAPRYSSRMAGQSRALDAVAAMAKRVRSAGTGRARSGELLTVVLDRASGKTLDQALSELRQQPDVQFAEPNYRYEAFRTPNDPSYPNQTFLPAIGAPAAWDRTTGSRNVVVAVIDTGVSAGHLEFASNKWSNSDELAGDGIDNDNNGFVDDTWGYDFVTAAPSSVAPGEDPGPPDNDPNDFDGHGTHVAGLVGASGNNGISGTGVAWSVSLMALRAGYRNVNGLGELQLDDIAVALRYAADNGAHIVNMSFGGPQMSYILADALRYAQSRGVLLVAAAGNRASSDAQYPAANDGVLSVAATNDSGSLAYFSSYGAWVDLAAPGMNILSTSPSNGMTTLSGTSMASPIVAGSAALIKAQNPTFTAERIAQQLTSTSTATTSGPTKAFGAGLVHAGRALSVATPPALFKVVSSAWEELSGDGDGFIEAGERARVHLAVKNFSTPQALSVALSTSQPGVAIATGTVALPSLGYSRIASAAFEVTLPTTLPPSTNVSFSANLSWSGGSRTEAVVLEAAPAFGTGRVLYDRYVGSHSVTTLPDGAVLVVGDTVGGGSPQPVVAAVRSPSGVWAPTVSLSSPGNAHSPKVSVTPSGSADVVYDRNVGDWNSQLFYRRYDAATATWSPEEQITTDAVIVGPGTVITKFGIASDRAGRTHVVWVDSATTPRLLRHAVRTGSTWSSSGVVTSFSDPDLNYAELDLYVLADDSRRLVFRLGTEGGSGNREGSIDGIGADTWQAPQPLTPFLSDRADRLFRDDNVYVFARRTDSVDPVELLRLSGTSWVTDRIVGSNLGGYAFRLNQAGTAKGPSEKLGIIAFQTPQGPGTYSSGLAGALTSVRAVNTSEMHHDYPKLAFDAAGNPHVSVAEHPPVDFWIDTGRLVYYSPVTAGVTFPSKPLVATSLSGTSLSASWASSHPAGIASYSYAIGTAPGLDDISRWSITSASNTVVDLSARPLGAGEVLYGSVRALSTDGYSSGPGYSVALDNVPTRPIPGRLEAESFDRFKDNDAAHSGNCGSGPVDAETTSDAFGGACNVGWTGPGEWLEYDVRAESEQRFDITVRVASASAGASFHVELDGVNVSGPLAGTTGGWQTWQNRVVPNVRVTPGRHVLKLVWDVGGTNVNYIDVRVSPPPGVRLPAKIEAESYIDSFDTTAGNSGGACTRPAPDNVDKETTTDVGGGCNVGWTAPGEWLDYEIYNPVPRSFNITARLASASVDKRVRLELDGSSLGVLTAPSGGSQAFQDRTLANVALPAGSHVLRVFFETGALNFNHLSFVGLGPEPTQSPIPGTLEAEAYDRYFDSTPGNSGGQCGADNVDKVTTQDPTGGVCHVTAITSGEWLEYDVYSPTARSYEVIARVASADSGLVFHYQVDDVQLGNWLVAPGLGATTFADRSEEIHIPAGNHRLKVFFDSPGINFNYLRIQ
jgi:subtilisin family serine protease